MIHVVGIIKRMRNKRQHMIGGEKMISKERIEELESYFWDETNDVETQEWRDDLNDEEEKLISEWDEKYAVGIGTLCKEIMKHHKS
jgi:hypothetical protein